MLASYLLHVEVLCWQL